MKVKYFALMLLSGFCLVLHVNASYYKNSYGVELTLEEYNFVNKLYGENYQDYLTQDDYDFLFSEDRVNSQVNTVEYEPVMSCSLVHTTNSKKISISSSCSSTCVIVTKVVWSTIPKVKSYDVIGAYFDGNSFVDKNRTYCALNGNQTNSENYSIQDNGFGNSIKLPSDIDASGLIVYQSFTVTKGGTIYASYQHAVANISLDNSKKYTISSKGYGNVFLFNSSIASYYDAMGGVSIAV